MKDRLRGYAMTPTVGNVQAFCGHCGIYDTVEGHDGCLGTLPNIMNACCGHGEQEDAYIQYWDGTVVRGHEALARIIARDFIHDNYRRSQSRFRPACLKSLE